MSSNNANEEAPVASTTTTTDPAAASEVIPTDATAAATVFDPNLQISEIHNIGENAPQQQHQVNSAEVDIPAAAANPSTAAANSSTAAANPSTAAANPVDEEGDQIVSASIPPIVSPFDDTNVLDNNN